MHNSATRSIAKNTVKVQWQVSSPSRISSWKKTEISKRQETSPLTESYIAFHRNACVIQVRSLQCFGVCAYFGDGTSFLRLWLKKGAVYAFAVCGLAEALTYAKLPPRYCFSQGEGASRRRSSAERRQEANIRKQTSLRLQR